MQNVLSADENVRIEIDHLLPKFAIEPGHDRDDENQDRDAERDAENRDQRDDGKKRALRFQIPQRQEKTKRQFQFADTVAVFRSVFQRLL